METRYSATIGRKGSHGCMINGADTLAELLASLADSFAYYRLAADWHDMTIETVEFCRQCDGQGTIPAKRRNHRKRCPSCKGAPIVGRSSANVPDMSETTCIAMRNDKRRELANWQAANAEFGLCRPVDGPELGAA